MQSQKFVQNKNKCQLISLFMNFLKTNLFENFTVCDPLFLSILQYRLSQTTTLLILFLLDLVILFGFLDHSIKMYGLYCIYRILRLLAHLEIVGVRRHFLTKT